MPTKRSLHGRTSPVLPRCFLMMLRLAGKGPSGRRTPQSHARNLSNPTRSCLRISGDD